MFRYGRMNRATYWVSLGLAIAITIIIGLYSSKHAGIGEVILIGVGIPRLHDIGKSGWWVGGLLFLEVVVAVIAFATLPLERVMAVLGGFVLVVLGFLIWLGTIPGEPNSNRFGDPPAPGLTFRRSKSTQ